MTPEILQKTKDYIKFRDSSIDITVSGTIETDIGFAEDNFSEAVFNDRYYKAVGLYVLHIRELNKINTANGSSLSGTIQSEKEDALAVTVDTSASMLAGADLARTGYGQELYKLCREMAVARSFLLKGMI